MRRLQALNVCRVAAIALGAASAVGGISGCDNHPPPWGVYSADARRWGVSADAIPAHRTATDWATGTRLRKQLAQPERISWSGNPLRQALGALSRTQHVAVLIDRRVDPGQKLDLQLDEVPLAAILQEIARSRQLGVSLLEPVAYFGPPGVSLRLRTIAALRTAEIHRLPIGVQRKFLLPKRIAWDDFATPRDLLAQLAEQNELEIRGMDRVPHDLWAAADLPPLSLVDRLTLITVQFDLTFNVSRDGKTLTLVPVSDEVALVRSYPGGREPKATAEKYALLAPEAQIKVVGNQVYVKGLLEAHERITSAGRPPKPHTPRPTKGSFANKRFTLRIKEKPVEVVLLELVEQLKLDLRIDHKALQEAGISLDSRISLSVQNATIDELLREVLKPARLRFRRRGNVVEVSPAQ
jgi:hypothetical protein